jgi:CDP-glycerol glycerophosphotransferase (TagB/SpsB family)
MAAAGLVPVSRCAVVGYPKFDVVDSLRRVPLRLFPEDRPVVLYNPHFDPKLSSWPRWGHAILAAFARQERYNLIFAPHIRLLEGARPSQVASLRAFQDCAHIHMDLGTLAAIDMTYTQMADIYLGDVSSQVYEFLRTRKPCLFLNSHDVAWRSDEGYHHWRFGPVADSADNILSEIDDARRSHADFRRTQDAGFETTFDLAGDSSSRRAARAIERLIDGGRAAGMGRVE